MSRGEFLLSNQTDKAVDLFLDMLQKQETENEIESNSQFEAELTLGNLFRSRGEVDRAFCGSIKPSIVVPIILSNKNY